MPAWSGMLVARNRRGSGDEGEGDELAWRLARQCRNVVQACLREEEWGDADAEFVRIISEGLSGTG